MTLHGPFTYRVSEDDAVAAAMIAFRRARMRGGIRVLIAVIVVLLVLLVLLDALDGRIELATTVPAVLALPVILLGTAWLMRRLARRQYHQSPAFAGVHEVSWDADVLHLKSLRGSASVPFAELHAFAESDRFVLIFQTEAFYNLIAKAALGEKAHDLVARIENAGVRRY